MDSFKTICYCRIDTLGIFQSDIESHNSAATASNQVRFLKSFVITQSNDLF